MKFRARMTGSREMAAKLRAHAKHHPEHVAAAEYRELSIDATEMKRRTPVDTRPNAPHPGNLRDSIHVEEPVIEGNKITTVVATGAQASEYDIHVHENPDAFHPIGEWKFMESVLNESRPYMAQRIANRIHFDKVRTDQSPSGGE